MVSKTKFQISGPKMIQIDCYSGGENMNLLFDYDSVNLV